MPAPETPTRRRRANALGSGLVASLALLGGAIGLSPTPAVAAVASRSTGPAGSYGVTSPIQHPSPRQFAAPAAPAPKAAPAPASLPFLSPDPDLARHKQQAATSPGSRAPVTPTQSKGAIGPLITPLVSSPSTLTSFPAMSRTQETSLIGSAPEPPDTQVAAGPTDVVEMVNSIGSIYTKTGTLLTTFNLAQFFQAPSGFFFSDPRVLYDAASGRFIATGVVFQLSGFQVLGSRVQLAISSTSDPTGLWTVYTLVQNSSGVLYDQPKPGVNADKVIVSWNDFAANTFTGGQTIVLQKSDLLAAAPAHDFLLNPDPTHSGLVPAQSLTATTTEYVLYNNSCSPATSCTIGSPSVGVIAFTGTPAQLNVSQTESDPAIAATATPPNATQPSPGSPIATNDDRLLSAVYQNGTIWTGANDACKPSGDATTRSCGRLIEVSVGGTTTVSQSFDLSSNSQYLYFPSVQVDPGGDMFAVYSESSSSLFAGVAVATQLSSAPPNTAVLGSVTAGAGVYGGSRWGDYSGGGVDPSDPFEIWLAGQNVASATDQLDWGTQITEMVFTPPTVTGVSPTSGPTNGGTAVVVTGTGFAAGATSVNFGGVASPNVNVRSATRLIANSPPGSLGTVDVTVTRPDGTSPISSADHFTYVTPPPPTLQSFTEGSNDTIYSTQQIAANPSGTYVGKLAGVVDAASTTLAFVEGANGHLFEFSHGGSSWSSPIDVTAGISGAPLISSSPTAVLAGSNVHVFSLAQGSGDLLDFMQAGSGGSWSVNDLNAQAPGSPHVQASLSAVVFGGLLHVYGTSLSGDLTEIDNDNLSGRAWNFYDLSLAAGGGVAVSGAPGALLIGIPHVYARAAGSSDLVEFVADHLFGRIWNAYDQTLDTPGSPSLTGNPIPTLIGSIPHVYVNNSSNGDLVEFVADHLFGRIWNAYDQTLISSAPKLSGNPSAVLVDGTQYGQPGSMIPEVFEAAVGGDLTAVVADHQGGQVWNVYDVTTASGGPQVTSDPSAIVNGSTVQILAFGG